MSCVTNGDCKFAPMRKLIPLTLIGFALLVSTSSCRKCYICKVQTEFGEVEREICGRKGDIQPLVSHLQSDTVGNGPWTCE